MFSMSLAIGTTIAPVTSSGETRNNAPLCMKGVEAHIGHSNVGIIDLAWGPERGSGHLVDRGCPGRHARGGTPLQINPKQVDAGRVGL